MGNRSTMYLVHHLSLHAHLGDAGCRAGETNPEHQGIGEVEEGLNRADIKDFVNQLFDEGLIDTEQEKLAVAKLLELWLSVKCEQCRKQKKKGN